MSKIPLDQGGYNLYPLLSLNDFKPRERSVLTKIYSEASEFSKPHNEFLGITNDFPGPSNSKIYGKESRSNGTSL